MMIQQHPGGQFDQNYQVNGTQNGPTTSRPQSTNVMCDQQVQFTVPTGYVVQQRPNFNQMQNVGPNQQQVVS